MRRFFLLLLLIRVLTVTASALPQEVMDTLPEEAQVLLEEAEGDSVQETMTSGWRKLLEQGRSLLGGIVADTMRPAVLVLGAVILCSMAESVYRGVDSDKVPSFVPLVGVLTITTVTASGVESMVGLGQETIEQLHIFSQALLPTLASAVSASGGLISAGVRQIATVWVSGLLISLIRKVLMPLVYCYIVAAAAHSMAPQSHLKGLGEAIRKGMMWVLNSALVLFTGYLAIAGTLAGSADSLTSSLTRSAISTAVPVVGSIISEAGSSVLAGATLLKNTIGVGGMLGVVAVCLTPFLTMGVQYLLFKIAAFLADILGTTLSDYIHALSSAFGLILGMVGTCALVLIVSIASSVSVVIG